MPHVSARIGEPVGSLDYIRCQVDALFTHFKAFMINLAEATVDVQIPAGDAGMVDVAIRSNDFFKATITALNANFFPRFLIHNR